MVVNVTCPSCGNKCRFPQDTPAHAARCPACLQPVPLNAPPAPSLLARSTGEPAPAAPVNRTMLAQPEPMVRYVCPRCNKSLESPASFAGQKLNCPGCNQRLQVPQPSNPAPPPVNKTILAVEQPPAAPAAPGPPPAGRTDSSRTKGQGAGAPKAVGLAPPGRREHCLECGADVSGQPQVQTCPDCGSLFCSARCYRAHSSHAHAKGGEAMPASPPLFLMQMQQLLRHHKTAARLRRLFWPLAQGIVLGLIIGYLGGLGFGAAIYYGFRPTYPSSYDSGESRVFHEGRYYYPRWSFGAREPDLTRPSLTPEQYEDEKRAHKRALDSYYAKSSRTEVLAVAAGIIVGLALLGTAIWLRLLLRRKSAARAEENISIKIEALQAGFPRECEEWGGPASLRDLDFVRDVVRRLEATS
jgi:DNA-directed RNA polymerase subunit RPC12/RpoP